jgi:transposase
VCSSDLPHLVLFPVHPTTAARYRAVFAPSGAKSDPSDTASLLDLLLHHRDQLRPLRPDTSETRLLHFLVEERRKLVQERTRQSNRLTQCLKLYFPQLLGWFDNVASPVLGALLERWPTLEQLQHVHPGTLRRFFHEHHCRRRSVIEGCLANLYQAVPATRDPAVVEAGRLIAGTAVALMAVLRSQIVELERRIAQLVATHPDAGVFASLPGAGPVLIPRLIVAFGTCRDRYQSAREMQCYSGIAPVTEASGNSRWVHRRFACPRFLRQTFHEFATHSIGKSVWAKAFYEHQREEKKKGHHAAVRALAFKWIRIMFPCWRDGRPYDEATYLKSIQRCRALQPGAEALATAAGWTGTAGFQKFSAKKT